MFYKDSSYSWILSILRIPCVILNFRMKNVDMILVIGSL